MLQLAHLNATSCDVPRIFSRHIVMFFTLSDVRYPDKRTELCIRNTSRNARTKDARTNRDESYE